MNYTEFPKALDEWAKAEELRQEVRALLDGLRKKYVPDESDRSRSLGQLGFDYGFHQALAEVDAGLYLLFREKVPA